MMSSEILAREMVHDVERFGGGEKADDAAVAEESQVPVIGHDVHGRVPGYLSRAGCAGPDVVHRADVAAVEADAGPRAEHGEPGGVVGFSEEG